MFQIYQSASINDNKLISIEPEIIQTDELNGLWIKLTEPKDEEITYLAERFQIDRQAFLYPLDEMEGPRIEQEENYTLIIVNYSIVDDNMSFDTRALGIILTDKAIFTVNKERDSSIEKCIYNNTKIFNTIKKGRFVFQLLYNITSLFVQHITQMGKRLDSAEERLKRTTQNKELLKLLDLNNSLTYFSTSLRGNQTVFEKISRNAPFRIYEEDRELLEDTIIENKQSIEMTKTYINILSSTMDAYASIIGNNLNNVMKFMTVWTIIIMVPSLVVNIYGMNIALPWSNHPFAFMFVLLICLFLTITLFIFFKKKQFF